VTSGAPADDRARAEYVKAYDDARAAGDHQAMAAAALRLAATRMFGLSAGRIPAFLHEAYTHAVGRQRVELAIAIARTWGYGYEPQRARAFAAEAIDSAEAADDPSLLAAALDAALIAAWGPDDFNERLRITARLEDTTAHLADPEVLMSAYLWRLTTALECLDVPMMRRQLRKLEQLAAETGSARVRFFAAARRGMHALVVGDPDAADRARIEAVAAGTEAGEPDAFAIDHALAGAIARQTGDVDTALREAAVYEEFGLREGITSIAAEGAALWVTAGEDDRAERLLHQLAGADFGRIPRDVDWLLTLTVLTEVAAKVGDRDLCGHAVALLSPYAGRGVANAGAVTFGGVVDHYLALAHDAIGNSADAAASWSRAKQAYDRFGASWWSARCPAGPRSRLRNQATLRPAGDGVWEVGRDRTATIREMKGLHYLRLLLASPGRDLSAVELTALAAGRDASTAPDSAGLPVADAQALTAYRNRLRDIAAELDDADARSDQRKSASLTAEREALLEALRGATGLGGRPRTTGAASERARVAVRKAIASTIGRIAEVDAPLSRLLEDTVTTGTVCRYDPDPDRPVEWLLS
jgi:hypothetical protein